MTTHAGYQLDDDRNRLDLDLIWSFLSTEAYWARWRTRADVQGQVASAWRVVGAYAPSGEQVGFARAWSDGVTSAYLGDVFVLAGHRGHGLGVAVVRKMIDGGPGAHLRWLLHTADAHSLYAKLGFAPPGRTYLERPRAQPEIDPWEADVAAVWAAARDADDDPDAEDRVVAHIEALAAQRPDTAAAAFELASAYDFVGREADAEPEYRRALAAPDLDRGRHPRAVLQLASTVRNLGRPQDALELLREPLPEPYGDAQAAFTALALLDAGRAGEAARTALEALAGRLPRYGRAVAAYTAELPPSSDS
jgi:tetratricopeptide (TPR) repeat protein